MNEQEENKPLPLEIVPKRFRKQIEKNWTNIPEDYKSLNFPGYVEQNKDGENK